jgi:hypothetical protein
MENNYNEVPSPRWCTTESLKHKVACIKALRLYTKEIFGVTLGLKEAKDVIESLIKKTDEESNQQLRETIQNLRAKGYSFQDIQQALDRIWSDSDKNITYSNSELLDYSEEV